MTAAVWGPPIHLTGVLDLSPTKLLIIFVVVVVLLGPKRLPQVARQMGAAWGKLRTMHANIDSELRRSVPDLPSSQEIVQYARSPRRLLDRLATLPSDPDHPANGDAVPSDHLARPADGGAPPATAHEPTRPAAAGTGAFRVLAGVDTDDPSLN